MEGLVRQYIEYMRDVKRSSNNTIVSYKRDLLKLTGYLEQNHIEEINSITETNLNSFVLYLESQGMATSSVSRCIASIKSFFQFLFKKHLIENDVAEHLRSPKIEKKVPHILSMEEIELLLAQPAGNTPKEIRDRAMLELLYATGIRVSELITMKLTQVHLSLSYIICGNGTKERIIPFDEYTKKALEHYIHQSRNSFSEESEFLFLNCQGHPMTRQGF